MDDVHVRVVHVGLVEPMSDVHTELLYGATWVGWVGMMLIAVVR